MQIEPLLKVIRLRSLGLTAIQESPALRSTISHDATNPHPSNYHKKLLDCESEMAMLEARWTLELLIVILVIVASFGPGRFGSLSL